MSLLDSIDGCFMNFAYGWAFSQPVRKVFYNITVTTLSVAVALLVGTVELLQVFSQRLGLESGFWSFLDALDFSTLGYLVVGLFVATWAVSLGVWKVRRVEERWSGYLLDRS
jgi:high-affinity nickel-transport protein